MLFNSTNTYDIIRENDYFTQMPEISKSLDDYACRGYFTSFDNTEMFYEFFKVLKPRANIVVVHGYTEFTKKYYELTLYFDAWNKEIIGYGLSSRKGDRNTYFEGLKQVLSKIKEEQIEEPIILHTDQGPVYSSKKYNNLLNEFNIQQSMSRAGTPTDNPVNESLNGWIKEELFIDFDLKHCEDVPNLIKLYIDYYNNERPSYALNYKTPIQYKHESGF